MIVVHLPNNSERWRYTLDFVFRLRGIRYEIETSLDKFIESTLPKFSFHELEIGSLLDETNLTNQTISKGNWKGEDCLSFNQVSDPLSSIFYVLSRMEEYYPRKKDGHNRFSAKDSIQFENDWLDKCICDRWALSLIKEIQVRTGLFFEIKTFETQLIPTFDIDNAFAYQLKNGKRKWLSIAKDLVQRNSTRLSERKNVLAGKQKDPYDTFGKITSIAKDFTVKIFWLVGDYGKYDNNINLKSKELQKLVNQLEEVAEIGIHPSYFSNSVPSKVKTEVKIVESVINKKITTSRQHFLKLTFPQTYRNLIVHQIKDDYTMGFADAVGFRNGTAHSFSWFDILDNKQTDLIIHPFAYMDGTLNEYLKITPEEAKVKIKSLYEEVLQMGGDFVFLWHNETIGDYGKWQGWSAVLDYTLTLKSK